MRPIDADKARENSTIDLITHFLDRQPTIDAVEVVRCKDCKHYRDWGDGNITCRLWTDQWDAATAPDAFCSFGERKEAENK